MKSTYQKGFTLLELVVVIAIVGILIGLLLPVLVTVRKHAKLTTCANNLTQVGMAITQYAASEDDWLPTGGANDTATHLLRNANASIGLGLLIPRYVDQDEKSLGILCCPANNWTSTRKMAEQWGKGVETGCTYVYRSKAGGSASKLDKARPILAMDYEETRTGVSMVNHCGAMQALVKDGHVKTLLNSQDRFVGDGQPSTWDWVFTAADEQLKP
jgi:prepilin-type N-terminal cleavage/methylation domain-containing protein